MRNLRVTVAALALLALGLGACGTEATGISLAIDPDPVAASARADGTYVANWDAVVANLTDVGGTVESVETSLAGATPVANLRANPAGYLLPSQSMAVAAFARRMFHQSAQFTVDAGGQPVTVQVTVRFRDENGRAYQESAQARIALR